MNILITGACGLIGTALTKALRSHGHDVIGIDIRTNEHATLLDVRDIKPCTPVFHGIAGVIHLAAVSRVIDGERHPGLCRSVNVDGTRQILRAATAARDRPWLIYASSREVYGQQITLPVPEHASLQPMNTYARSKVDAENLVRAAAHAGLRAAIVRFSNVYGTHDDHATRVVPAFARAAAHDLPLQLEGASNTFDFTHVDDVVGGVSLLAELLHHSKEAPDPIHFVSGNRTSLEQLACTAIREAAASSPIIRTAPRRFDVAHFCGDPRRAYAVLGWTASTPLQRGVAHLIAAFRHQKTISHDSPDPKSIAKLP